MLLVFSDMDGCLLDHATYEWLPALPALKELARLGAPLILTTSKTRAEVEYWASVLGLHHPSIVENGGAIVFPRGSSIPPPAECEALPSGEVILLGWPHLQLVKALHAAAAESRCEIRGFSDMAVEEIAAHCDMPLELAALASQREFSEPFLLLTPRREPDLLRAFLAHGLKLTRGGRFYHAQRHEGKGAAVARMIEIVAESHAPVVTIGLGDGFNDEGFLKVVDYPVILQSSQSAELSSRIPHARTTDFSGPAAWAQALLAVLGDCETDEGPAA